MRKSLNSAELAVLIKLYAGSLDEKEIHDWHAVDKLLQVGFAHRVGTVIAITHEGRHYYPTVQQAAIVLSKTLGR